MDFLSLFGGIGGALVTFSLAQFVAKRAQKRIVFREEIQQYSLPEAFVQADGDPRPLHVSWADKAYESLGRATYEIKNIGRKTVRDAIFLIRFPESSEVLEMVSIVWPVSEKLLSKERKVDDFYEVSFTIPPLEHRDEVQIFILFNGAPPSYRGVRNLEDVRLVSQFDIERQTTIISSLNRVVQGVLVAVIGVIPLVFWIREIPYQLIKERTSGLEFLIAAISLIGCGLATVFRELPKLKKVRKRA